VLDLKRGELERDGPREQNVATILRAAIPLLPTPVTRILPCGGMLWHKSTTWRNATLVRLSTRTSSLLLPPLTGSSRSGGRSSPVCDPSPPSSLELLLLIGAAALAVCPK